MTLPILLITAVNKYPTKDVSTTRKTIGEVKTVKANNVK